jgi:hypothetical protein
MASDDQLVGKKLMKKLILKQVGLAKSDFDTTVFKVEYKNQKMCFPPNVYDRVFKSLGGQATSGIKLQVTLAV